MNEAYVFPLSFSQQRLFLLDQLEPGGHAYNIAVGLRLRGELDAASLERSLAHLVARHDALRTTFEEDGGEPVQVVHEEARLAFRLLDLQGREPAEREATVEATARDEAATPFDLRRGPLFRATLVRLDRADHVLLLAMHHIVSDGWSMGVLVNELLTLYTAFRAGADSPLAPLEIQYPDYAQWQRKWLQGETLAAQTAYWRDHLADAPTQLDLQTDHPRPAVRTSRGDTRAFELPATLMEKAVAFGNAEHATPFMTLLAAFQALLFRHSGQGDVVVGTPIANRSRAELEPLIGFFVNTLALRARITGRMSFRELVRQVRETALGAFAHQDFPFEKLVEELRPPRDLSRTPIFQAMFSLQNMPSSKLELDGLSFEPLPEPTGTSKFDLSLSLSPRDRGMSGSLEYSTDLFDAATAARLATHYKELLESALRSPDAPLESLSMMPRAERRTVLVDWNDTERGVAPDATIHGMFEAQAARTPDAIALSFEDERLTYAELDARANRLANYLRRFGVGPDVRVGVCVERSLELVTALLGIMKAGGAYVPLDPGYPEDRLAFMLEDAAAPVVVTESKHASLLGGTAARVVSLDDDWGRISKERAVPPSTGLTNKHLAYVIYTSGSTGRPKGAMNAHDAVCNRLEWMPEEIRLGPGDRVLQKTPFSFDVSVWEMFWPLVHGAHLVVAIPDGHKDTAYLAETIAREQITLLHFVPSMLQIFLDQGGLDRACASVTRVLCSGEALPLEVERRFFEALPHARLFNLYGPTEAAVEVTWHRCAVTTSARSVPIGAPIQNAQMYVLDANLEPRPIGVAGELYIAGMPVARGYLGRTALTAEKFVPDPFGVPGSRMYKTGDLCRWLADGEVEYLGRLDHQVKIRGFRIELGEIESALRDLADVGDAVALVREDQPGDKRLVAYVAGPVDRLDPKALTAELAKRLPPHMVPSAVVPLAAFPLTPSGKTDRRALPAPRWATDADDGVSVAPRDAFEAALVAIWTSVLGVPSVGVHTDFFAAGGHSLAAVRVRNAIEARFGVRVALSELFRHPTIEALASVVRAGQGISSQQTLVELRSGTGTPLFLVHPVDGGVMWYTGLARELGDRPVYGLQIDEATHSNRRERSIVEYARTYLAEIRAVQPRGPYLLGGWSMGALVAFEMASQLLDAGEAVSRVLLVEPPMPSSVSDPAPDVVQHVMDFANAIGIEADGLDLTTFPTGTLDEQLAWLRPVADRARGLPAGLSPRELEDRFVTYLANRRAMVAYVPQARDLTCAVFAARDRTDAEALGPRWAKLARSTETFAIPGDHHSILRPPALGELAAAVRATLQDASSAEDPGRSGVAAR
jgi:amino acid adenylation domain-containing protein